MAFSMHASLIPIQSLEPIQNHKLIHSLEPIQIIAFDWACKCP